MKDDDDDDDGKELKSREHSCEDFDRIEQEMKKETVETANSFPGEWTQ